MNIETTNAPNTTETAIGFIPCYRLPFLSLFHADCMEIMKQYPDKYFDLAIVDPPYGINRLEMSWTAQSNSNNGKSQADSSKWASYEIKKWDNQRPSIEYWDELKRVSKNQIVWGANYFPEFFTENMGVVFWDKIRSIDVKFSHGELAFTTFGGYTRKFPYNPEKYNKQRFHPTQKPIALYEYLLREFATEGMKILDTHFGSGSIALAVDKANRLDKMNLHLTACEIDKEYIDKAIKRISESIKQGTLSF